ncbi:hypothetical protein [Streptomyces avermitilis]|uniref:hypothetical protein n=1 Tax=Streptomyces avermitilis TaxID=33903 RepID=UPI0033D6B02E
MPVESIAVIAGNLALIVTVGVLAWQTKKSNDLAGASVISNAMAYDRDVDRVMLRYPGLRPHFYEGKPCPPRGVGRERVLILTGMYADVLDGGLLATRLVPSTESYEDWKNYSQFILNNSPTMRDFVREYPHWFPDLAKLL